MPRSDEDLITASEAAKILGVSRQTVYNYKDDGILQSHVKVEITGRKRYFFSRQLVVEVKETLDMINQ